MVAREKESASLAKLLDVLDRLRLECPWDRKQTFESMKSLTVEEVYELVDAIGEQKSDEIKKELGDVLLHVVFYAKMAEEKGWFDVSDVMDSLVDKLIFRHPHIFSDTKVEGEEQVLQNWEKLKLKEKGGNKRVLEGVPKSLPPLIKASRIQEKARNVGFDWDKKEDVWTKVKEELNEVEQEMIDGTAVDLEGEFGDLLFSVVNAARLYGVDPNSALERTNMKFTKRFNYIEEKSIANSKPLDTMTLEEMDVLWNEAKNL
ncbi:nucleoside triphosphate pyrophosphohydrolase [Halosquirtibacter xylanolyticus]|uniref:nucleoside triphosphate pyrophosphohydrolase n=1 Tax=Halosquirtibacter xylanolyticus TaxID=3374599 RepID=UPI0037492C91|nr:nucleoside triphosphate pyrophosphohydrolase [Prolixibacteraceae bacterium]